MQKRKLLLAALAVSSIGAIPLAASADVGIWVNEAPPPMRHEVVPAARHGYVWAPGYWDYRNHHYVWVKGHWEKERHGQYWHPNRWVERDGRWTMEKGRWDRERYVENRHGNGDRDHDGVPNKYDRDKDGDGVPNKYDDSPNNPRRH
jgi:hypothetical protein